MRVGVLTGGGDCPGLNAVIRAIVRTGVAEYGYEFTGFRDGWRGPLEGDTMPLDVQAVRGILPRGGTILGTSRTNPLGESAASGGRSGLERIQGNLADLGIDALVAIGGEDTLGVAARLHEQMGRNAGWIALHAGMAGGANVILIPEQPFDIEQVCGWVEHRFQTRYAPIVVVAEGAHPKSGAEVAEEQRDAFGHVRYGGVGQMLAGEIEQRTGKEARVAVLGHIQRGGTPTAFDRVLATRFGEHAIRAVADGAFGAMVALRGTDIVRVPIAAATQELKLVPPERYAEAELFFG